MKHICHGAFKKEGKAGRERVNTVRKKRCERPTEKAKSSLDVEVILNSKELCNTQCHNHYTVTSIVEFCYTHKYTGPLAS